MDFLFSSTPGQKLGHLKTEFKQNLVDRHLASPQQRCIHHQNPTGKLRSPAEVGANREDCRLMKPYDYVEYAKHYDARETKNRYNWKYRTALREGDKRVLELLRDIGCNKKEVTLVDLGCGNGNLLYHLKQDFPSWSLAGRDLAAQLISECNTEKELEGIAFSVADLAKAPSAKDRGKFDFVILVAVLQVLPPAVLKKAVASISAYLKPGGWLLNFDGYHPYEEHECIHVEVVAPKAIRPDLPAMNYFYPSYKAMGDLCRKNGFSKVEFEPFFMPFDLPRPKGNPAGSHTEKLPDGRRLSMLGVIAQPWCFLKARKAMR